MSTVSVPAQPVHCALRITMMKMKMMMISLLGVLYWTESKVSGRTTNSWFDLIHINTTFTKQTPAQDCERS